MTEPSRKQDELFSLIESAAEDRLTAAESTRLAEILRSDPEARRLYVQCMCAQSILERYRSEHVAVNPAAPTPPATDARPLSPVLGFLGSLMSGSAESPGVTAFLWMVMATLTAVVLTLVIVVVVAIRGVHVTVEPQQESRQQAAGRGQKAEGEPKPETARSNPQSPIPNPSPVARLNRLADCRWTLGEDEQEPAVGDDLVEGQVLRLKSGLAEILFRNGARTLLQGPARLEVLSRSSAQLHRGTLTARVEVPSAKGFTIHTPAMRLVDLGTEFGVMVKRDGAEEVHVFRGQVQAERVQGSGFRVQGSGQALPSPAPVGTTGGRGVGGEGGGLQSPIPNPSPLLLSANEALRVSSPAAPGKTSKPVERIVADDTLFVRAMSNSAAPVHADFRIAGAIECEDLPISASSPGLRSSVQKIQDIGLSQGSWSADRQLWVLATKPGDYIELTIPVKDNRPRKVTLYATKSFDYGIVRMTINGQRAGNDYDAFSPHKVASGPIELGLFEPKDGKLVLRVEVVGRNPKAMNPDASYFGLDAVVLE